MKNAREKRNVKGETQFDLKRLTFAVSRLTFL